MTDDRPFPRPTRLSAPTAPPTGSVLSGANLGQGDIPTSLPEDARLLSAEEVAEAGCVSLRTVRLWIAEGNLQTVRLGRCVRVRLSEWRRFVLAREARNGS